METQEEIPIPTVFLRGEHLVLRPTEEADAERFYQWINDPDTRRYITIYLPMTLEQEREFARGDRRGNTEIVLAVVEGSPGNHIGTVGLQNINWRNRTAVFGFMLGDKTARGKGYGIETMKMMLGYAFGTLNLWKIKSAVLVPNTPSLRCHTRLNFREVGTLKGEYFIDGERVDEKLFELTAEEWFSSGQ